MLDQLEIVFDAQSLSALLLFLTDESETVPHDITNLLKILSTWILERFEIVINDFQHMEVIIQFEIKPEHGVVDDEDRMKEVINDLEDIAGAVHSRISDLLPLFKNLLTDWKTQVFLYCITNTFLEFQLN